MAKTDRIKLTKETKEKAIQEIREYFASERNEEIGNLAGEIILDFITEKIGSYYYNQGIADAEKYMHEKADDLFGLMI